MKSYVILDKRTGQKVAYDIQWKFDSSVSQLNVSLRLNWKSGVVSLIESQVVMSSSLIGYTLNNLLHSVNSFIYLFSFYRASAVN